VIEQAMKESLAAHAISIDYAAVVHPESLEPLDTDAAGAVALVAGRLGSTRLIDNLELSPR
jgi:pantoate--beta-alanine ligase